ncbi:MAG TPA: hypothetical protein VK947_08825 [Planococcus sp. (in: firmicutes)]|nr:hypothetical protein [Planococcus sp. (in: firmicutes)]
MRLFKWKKVNKYKENHCFGCARPFPENAMHEDNKADDLAYCCPVCAEYWKHHVEEGALIDFGQLKSNNEQRWEDYRKQVEG